MKPGKLALIGVVIALVVVFFAFDLAQYFNLAYFESQRSKIETYQQANPVRVMGIYLVVYIAVFVSFRLTDPDQLSKKPPPCKKNQGRPQVDG